jgi:hypothetical protein
MLDMDKTAESTRRKYMLEFVLIIRIYLNKIKIRFHNYGVREKIK